MSHPNKAPLCPTCNRPMKHTPQPRNCAKCGEVFTSWVHFQKFCSKRCYRNAARLKPERVERRKARFKIRRKTDIAYTMRTRESSMNYYYKIAKFNPITRIRSSMRKRIRKIIRSVKSVQMQVLIGCTGAELREHLEAQFKEGMTWANYGKHWVVDHVKPLCKFDLTNTEHLKKCCHFTNLQPLTYEENATKAAQWEELVVPCGTMSETLAKT